MDIPAALEWMRRHIWLTLAVLIIAIIGYGVYDFVGSVASKMGENTTAYKSFMRSTSNYSVVERQLREYLPRYNISRIGIARFQRTLLDIGANAVFYYSYESIVVAPGVNSEIEGVQRLPPATISNVLPDLFDGRSVFVWTRELDDGPMKELLLRRGARASLYIPISDLSEKLVGMIVIIWLSELDVPKKSERDQMIEELSQIANRLGAFISGKK